MVQILDDSDSVFVLKVLCWCCRWRWRRGHRGSKVGGGAWGGRSWQEVVIERSIWRRRRSRRLLHGLNLVRHANTPDRRRPAIVIVIIVMTSAAVAVATAAGSSPGSGIDTTPGALPTAASRKQRKGRRPNRAHR